MPEVAVYAPGTPMWIDLGSPDVPGSIKFYTELFGWTTEDQGAEAGHYHMAFYKGKRVAGISPLPEGVPVSTWNTYIATESADETTSKVRDAGGEVLLEPMDVMDAGRMAVYKDPTGAVFGIWQAGKHTGAELANETGSFCWNELQTRDTASARKFYNSVFGWTSNSVGGPTEYNNWQLSGSDKVVGGMMNMPAGPP